MGRGQLKYRRGRGRGEQAAGGRGAGRRRDVEHIFAALCTFFNLQHVARHSAAALIGGLSVLVALQKPQYPQIPEKYPLKDVNIILKDGDGLANLPGDGQTFVCALACGRLSLILAKNQSVRGCTAAVSIFTTGRQQVSVEVEHIICCLNRVVDDTDFTAVALL